MTSGKVDNLMGSFADVMDDCRQMKIVDLDGSRRVNGTIC